MLSEVAGLLVGGLRVRPSCGFFLSESFGGRGSSRHPRRPGPCSDEPEAASSCQGRQALGSAAALAAACCPYLGLGYRDADDTGSSGSAKPGTLLTAVPGTVTSAAHSSHWHGRILFSRLGGGRGDRDSDDSPTRASPGPSVCTGRQAGAWILNKLEPRDGRIHACQCWTRTGQVRVLGDPGPRTRGHPSS
jgi:hypothetical protein